MTETPPLGMAPRPPSKDWNSPRVGGCGDEHDMEHEIKSPPGAVAEGGDGIRAYMKCLFMIHDLPSHFVLQQYIQYKALVSDCFIGSLAPVADLKYPQTPF